MPSLIQERYQIFVIVSRLLVIMSSKRECTNTGTNSQGNEYRAYSDGAYSYKNYNSSGETSGRYYNTGSGHDFYNPSGASRSDGQQAWHGNQNTGERTYTASKK